MVGSSLTQELIDQGKELLKALDEAGVRARCALWFLFPDEGAWKLVLSFPNLDEEGPRKAYARVQKVLSKVMKGRQAPLRLYDITILKPDSPLMELLRAAVITAPDAISDIRFTNNAIDGQLIPDAHIYRLGKSDGAGDFADGDHASNYLSWRSPGVADGAEIETTPLIEA